MKFNKTLNHSAAHLLAAAVKKIYPEVLFGIGPTISEGFYYDFKFSKPITDEDLDKIEKEMRRLVKGGYRFEEVNFKIPSTQKYKKELIKDLKKDKKKIKYYAMINPSNNESIFTDLCSGPHIKSVASLKHFKLLSIAGAYWKGESSNDQLTRIYGTAWETAEDLISYLKLLEERKERDHRTIGMKQKIFSFDNLAGRGFPIFLENGMIIKNTIQSYIRKVDAKYGFKEVQTPSFGNKKLYEISGHWKHYKDDMFPLIKLHGSEELVMRPMTCPHHILLYAQERHSYKELPIRYSEQARIYRYEKSGALTGLERVRSMELTEGHIFARLDQIELEFKNAFKLINEVLEKFKIKIDYVSLSLRDKNDKEKYFDDDRMWNKSEKLLKSLLTKMKIKFEEKKGEAAFYGPKIDIQVKTALGHEITLSTLQLDFLLPKKFNISYIDKNEKQETPILIHRGLIGTYERFISIILEQTKGNLPFWLAPRQIVIIPVLAKHKKYSKVVLNEFKSKGYRVELDDRNERISKKIREHQINKVKYQIVIGDEEVAKKTITYREYGSQKQITIPIKKFNPQ